MSVCNPLLRFDGYCIKLHRCASKFLLVWDFHSFKSTPVSLLLVQALLLVCFWFLYAYFNWSHTETPQGCLRRGCSSCAAGLQRFGQAQDTWPRPAVRGAAGRPHGPQRRFGLRASFCRSISLCWKILQRFSRIFRRPLMALSCISSSKRHSNWHSEQPSKKRSSRWRWKGRISKFVLPHFAPLAPCVMEREREKRLCFSAAFWYRNPALKR